MPYWSVPWYYDLIERHGPAMSSWETYALLCLLSGHRTRTVLEVGTHRSGSLRLWRDALDAELVIGVDWCGESEGDRDRITTVEGLASHAPRTLQRVRDVLDGRPIDFLCIDGGHSYGEVSADWELYSPLLAAGGAAALHGVAAEPGVAQLWAELRALPLRTVEISDRFDCAGTGVGMVCA